MKKIWYAAMSVALSGCLLVSFAGCGAVSKAKSMKGDVVTEDVWNSAMAGTSFTASSGSATAQTVADETASAPNYKAEYGYTLKTSVETEAVEGGIVSVEAMQMSIDMKANIVIVVADSSVKFTIDYDFKLDGSENLMKLLFGEDGNPSEKGKKEIYLSYADGAVSYYAQDENGAWQKFSGSLSGIDTLLQGVLETCEETIDQSALVGAFSKYTYNDELKGYALVNGEASGSLGDDFIGMASANLVYKIKDGKLGAIYSSASLDSTMAGMKMSGSGEVGIVYTYGGQSVTLPAVA